MREAASLPGAPRVRPARRADPDSARQATTTRRLSSSDALDARLASALRKAYVRDDLRLHGVATPIVQALVGRGLAHAEGGHRDLHVLSSRGAQVAADLVRALLAQRGEPTPTPASAASSPSGADQVTKIAWCERVVDFVSGTWDPQATALSVELPATARTPAGRRAKIDRCGPTKFLIVVR